jgi:hypothetical protein
MHTMLLCSKDIYQMHSNLILHVYYHVTRSCSVDNLDAIPIVKFI